MKYSFLILGSISCILLLTRWDANAQGVLQFNAVKNINLYITGPGSSTADNDTVITIPQGKVWKVESASTSENYVPGGWSPYLGDGAFVFIDNTVVYFSDIDYRTPFPLWLKAGTHNFTLSGYQGSSSQYEWRALISAIEFNVVP